MFFKEPIYLYLLIPLLLILLFITFKRFVKTNKKNKWKNKIAFFLSRLLIITLLVLALANPFITKETMSDGNPSITILVDNSTSMQLFDTSFIDDMEQQLKQHIPVERYSIAHAQKSAIGDGIINNLRSNDNIILITDGNNNYGSTIGDVALLASSLNTSINRVNLNSINNDASVTIKGPKQLIADVDNEFEIHIEKVGTESVYLQLTIDGEMVINKQTTESVTHFTRNFDEGSHKMIAEIVSEDHFTQNDKFYKNVFVAPKPKILFVSKEDSVLLVVLNEVYDVEKSTVIKDDLTGYYAVVLNNINTNDIPDDKVNLLIEYLYDGNGLFVVGGKDSYENGNYENSFFSTILPVNTGAGSIKPTSDLNVVVLIDISESGSKVTKAIDLEKAYAINLLDNLRDDDFVGVVAFNTESFVVSPLSRLYQKNNIDDKITRLNAFGSTYIHAGITKATSMLSGVPGSKNIVLLSDGRTQNYDDTKDALRAASRRGIKIYTIGICEVCNTDDFNPFYGVHERYMKDIARRTGGIYFAPKNAERINLIFNRPDNNQAEDTPRKGLVVLDFDHFITEDLELGASIFGYNQVVPKSAAQVLITTTTGHSVVTVWRYGLGRVASLSTDDGTDWATSLVDKANSEILSRITNWAIGDINRNKDYFVDIGDTNINQITKISVISKELPKSDKYVFTKVGDDYYTSEFIPKETGFTTILGRDVAVNYELEYKDIGMNPSLDAMIQNTGGKAYDVSNIQYIIDDVKESSKRIELRKTPYKWAFLLAALILFLIEIAIRRIAEFTGKEVVI